MEEKAPELQLMSCLGTPCKSNLIMGCGTLPLWNLSICSSWSSTQDAAKLGTGSLPKIELGTSISLLQGLGLRKLKDK